MEAVLEFPMPFSLIVLINPAWTQHDLFYVNIQFVPHSKYYPNLL